MFTLNSIERVDIEEAFMRIFWLDKAVVELKYVIGAEEDANMKKVLGIAQARLEREMNDGWINLCRVTKRYTEPPYLDKAALHELALLSPNAPTMSSFMIQRINELTPNQLESITMGLSDNPEFKLNLIRVLGLV